MENFEQEDISAFQSLQSVKSKKDDNKHVSSCTFCSKIFAIFAPAKPGVPIWGSLSIGNFENLEEIMELPLEQVDSDRLVANVDE